MKKKIIYGIFFIICLVLYFFNLKYKLVDLKVNSFKYYLCYFIYAAIICVVLVFLITNNNKWNYTKMFIIFSLLLGSIYLVSAPLFTGSDEQSHYYRTYEIVNGNLSTPIENDKIGSEMPSSLAKTFTIVNPKMSYNYNLHIKYSTILKMSKIPLNRNQIEKYNINGKTEYGGAALYSPLQYVPHILGFSIGKILNLGPYWIGMLGRIFNFLVFVIICSYGIHLLPKSKLFAMVVLLSPSVISGATTLSGDGFTYALIFLFISYMIYFYQLKKEMRLKDKIIIGITAIFISVCKLVYLPILLLMFLLPSDIFKSKKEKYIFITVILFLGVLFSGLWMNVTSEYLAINYPNSIQQKNFLFNHLFEYLFIVIRTFCEKFTILLSNLFVGDDLYYSQLPIYSIISFGYIAIAALTMFNDSKKNYIKKQHIIYSCLLMLVLTGLVVTALYIQCTAQYIKVGNITVSGLHGRYFIPLLFILMIILNFKKEILSNKTLIDLFILIQYPILLTMFVQFIV